MNIGIIVHSNTGNTHFVAEKIREELLAAGHMVSLEHVTAENDREPDYSKVQLTEIPDINAYDVLIFGAPVRGMAISPVIKAYLSQILTFQGKGVECFVTQYFPYSWMGGNWAVKQMAKICESKGARILGTGIVNWSSKHRNEKIKEIVEQQRKIISS